MKKPFDIEYVFSIIVTLTYFVILIEFNSIILAQQETTTLLNPSYSFLFNFISVLGSFLGFIVLFVILYLFAKGLGSESKLTLDYILLCINGLLVYILYYLYIILFRFNELIVLADINNNSDHIGEFAIVTNIVNIIFFLGYFI